jgi:hypothetical protein
MAIRSDGYALIGAIDATPMLNKQGFLIIAENSVGSRSPWLYLFWITISTRKFEDILDRTQNYP